MKINWKLRLKNKVTLLSLAALIVGFIYQACGVLGIVPPISQDEVIQGVGLIINILVVSGVVTDPTTAGLSDSKMAAAYDAPRKDE